MIEVTYFDLAEYVRKNDTKSVVNVFEEMGLSCDNSEHPGILPQEREALMVILRTASSMAYANELTERMAWTIINYTSPVVDIFSFAHVVSICEPIDDFKSFDFPESVKMALLKNDSSGSVLAEIKTLSRSDMFAMLNFITYKVRRLGFEFSYPTIRRFFGERFMPRSLIFAYMSTCLIDACRVVKINDF